MARRPAPLLAVAAALLLAGCGDSTPSTPPPAGPAAGSPPPTAQMTVTHILVAYRSPDMPAAKRSKEQAHEVAKSLLQEAVGGRSFEELVEKFTDDRDRKTDKPNTNNGKPGSYTFPPPRMVPEFEKTARETPVGKIAPEPVETKFGYHIIRRDK